MVFLNQILGGFIGIAIHVFVVKIPSYKKKCKAAGISFSIKEYFKADYIAIIGSVLTVLGTVYTLDEIMKGYPSFKEWVKLFMIAIGYTGSSLAIAILGKAGDALIKTIGTNTEELKSIKEVEENV